MIERRNLIQLMVVFLLQETLSLIVKLTCQKSAFAMSNVSHWHIDELEFRCNLANQEESERIDKMKA